MSMGEGYRELVNLIVDTKAHKNKAHKTWLKLHYRRISTQKGLR